MDGKPFAIVVLALIVLIALAVWQFYSLAWSEPAGTSFHQRAPSEAAAPRSVR